MYFPVGAQLDGIAELEERRENRVQVETPRGFALLGPWVRVVERMVGDVPLACLDLPEGEPPEVEQFRAHEECVLREGCRPVPCTAGLREPGRGLVDAYDGNARIC